MKLSKKARQAITEDVKLKLSLSTGKSISTIRNWIKDDSERLTTIKTIEAIKEHTGLTQDEIFENL